MLENRENIKIIIGIPTMIVGIMVACYAWSPLYGLMEPGIRATLTTIIAVVGVYIITTHISRLVFAMLIFGFVSSRDYIRRLNRCYR